MNGGDPNNKVAIQGENKKKGSSEAQHQCSNESVWDDDVAETKVPGHLVTGRPADANWEHPRNDPISNHHQR